VTAGQTLRVAAVLDVTGPSAEPHARALGGFLTDGLELADGTQLEVVTHVLGVEGPDDERVPLAPTEEVRLVRVPPQRPDAAATALAAFHADDDSDLYVFPAGPAGVQLAARLAARGPGSVVTGVLSARLAGGALTCRRTVYAGHLAGDFVLGPRPWCLVLDADWDEARYEPPEEHVVQSAAHQTAGGVSAAPVLLEIERLEATSTSDLETARVLVIAGRGAGSRSGVERIAAAAARMGAAFGATRPVVMNAWAGPDRQVGVSGTRTDPAVCIVAGASGAPAFVWGVERAAFIAAVDTDDHAPIAGESDAFVAGDAVAVLEALAELVSGAETE
jgi:electron transfer flavoprotein alpha subunit